MAFQRLLTLTLALTCGFLFAVSCNENDTPANNNTPAGGTVCIWISAVKDTYVSCGRTASCEEGDLTYGTSGQLVVAGGLDRRKRSYVGFDLPTFPAGTEILEAWLELYHSGKNEDGQTDDLIIPFGGLAQAFKPLTVTYRTRPDPDPSFGSFGIKLRSQAWSGSQNIKDTIRGYLKTPASFHGFFLYWDSPGPFPQTIEKGFYSNNELQRTQTALGRAPRLLLKVRFPDGKGTSDMVLPFIDSDNDLAALARPLTTLLFRQGTEFPPEWEFSGGW